MEKSDDGFAIVAEYFGRGMFRKQYDVDDTAAKALEGIKLKKNPIVENVQPKSDKHYSPKLTLYCTPAAHSCRGKTSMACSVS